MVNRKKPYQKNLRISAEDRARAKFLREAEELGLTDSKIYGQGLTSYEEKLEAIRREQAARDARGPPPKIKPAIPENVLEAMRESAHDEADKPFMTEYQRKLARIRGEKVEEFDRFGFKKYPEPKPVGVEHGLDNMFSAGDQAPPAGLLEFYTLSLESWRNLLESERLALKEKWEFKETYGNLR